MSDVKSFWCKVFFSEFVFHFAGKTNAEIVKDVRESMRALSRRSEEGDSFGAMMVVRANSRRSSKAAEASRENGKNGGRPKNTMEGAANGNNADVSANAPTVDSPATQDDWKSLVSASLSMAGTLNNEAEVTTKNQRQRRAGGSVREAVDPFPPARQRVKLPSSMQDVADFANRENLDYDDARLWWEQNFVERNGKDKDGNRITNWHGALINFCKSQENKRNG